MYCMFRHSIFHWIPLVFDRASKTAVLYVHTFTILARLQCFCLEEAKKTALGIYAEILNNKKYACDINKNCKYKKIHLVESKKLNKKEIECFLDESEKYIHFNKKNKKKSTLLEGRSVFNLFFEDSTRTRTSFEVAAKRLGADLINVALKDSSIRSEERRVGTECRSRWAPYH